MIFTRNTIDNIIQKSVSDGSTIGADCLVFHNGEEIYSGCFGYADKESASPMRRDSICRLFSLTKPITAAAAMIAADMGLFAPDTELREIFPEFSDMTYITPEGKAEKCQIPITMEHLFTMTSGLAYPGDWCESAKASAKLLEEAMSNNLSTADIISRAAGLPLYNIPGEYWLYGISADVTAAVIEKASGMKYSEFLHKYILDPLGMTDTDFYVPKEKFSRLASIYKYTEIGLVKENIDHLGIKDRTEPPAFESGGAGLFSTIDDYAKFANMLCSGGVYNGRRFISEKAFDYMTSPKLSANALKGWWDRLSGYNYSCFMRVMANVSDSQIHTANGEFGWDGWSGTYFCCDVKNKITILYFTQICHASTTPQAVEIDKAVYDKLIRK
ncbi:MAG: beta-lactamase family protein [Ruminococcus sp.]|nr:beta-lactamase family protein [Ruminococcus sp.]